MLAIVRAIRRFAVRHVLPDAIEDLDELARNLRWSWHEPTRALFESIDPDRWREVGHDPMRMLGATPVERLDELAADEQFVQRVEHLAATRWSGWTNWPRTSSSCTGWSTWSPPGGAAGRTARGRAVRAAGGALGR